MEIYPHHILNPQEELAALGCDAQAIPLASPRLRFLSFKMAAVPLPAALALKHEALAQGAEVILPAAAENRQTERTELLLLGTEEQLTNIAFRLQALPDHLAALGESLSRAVYAALPRRRPLVIGGREFMLGERTIIMGILNLTPDSFSDGGRFYEPVKALEHAMRMQEEGADIIDVGGESTRPGHQTISEEEELRRVMPVIEALKKNPSFTTPLSIDTSKAAVARRALEAGVDMVNDIWGFTRDPDLPGVAAAYNVPVCLMHNREHTRYGDLMSEIAADLRRSVALALQAGVAEHNIIIDPGIGFGKDLEQNLEVMRRLSDLCLLGYPLLLGTSRKSLIGKTLNLPVDDRLEGTAATVAWGIAAGCDIVRVHDVQEMRRVAIMTDAMLRRKPDAPNH